MKKCILFISLIIFFDSRYKLSKYLGKIPQEINQKFTLLIIVAGISEFDP